MNELEGYSKVCKLSDLQEKLGKRFFVDDTDIALFKVDGKVFAVSNICPHQKAQLIYDGYVEDGIVNCPAHGWQFDLSTGNIPGSITGLSCYEVKIINTDVFVKVNKKELNW
jgi:3-phenylpropionate/trans-cinnamate dioxygenase ferredoxin subunit